VSKDNPLVSIVTPTLNSAGYLPDLIAAVEAQSYANIEHVLVDGASTDGTIEQIRDYASRGQVRWVSEPDSGTAEAITKGYRMATGDIVVLIPSDDLIFPWSVNVAVDHFRSHPEVDIVHGDSISWDMTTDTWSLRLHKRFSYGYFARTQTMTAQATYLLRHVIQGNEELDPSVPHASDYEQFFRLTRGRKVVNIPEVLAIFRKRPGAMNMRDGASELVDQEVGVIRARYIRTSGPIYRVMKTWDRVSSAIHRRWQIFRLIKYSSRTGGTGTGLKPGTPWRNFLSAYTVSSTSASGLLSTLLPRRRQYPIDIWSRSSAENLGVVERPMSDSQAD
jgi:glycosyltransferase involved in cell wall biosynthesis